MSYIEELRNLVCGQVEKYIRNVLRSENVDNDERSGFLSGESESDDYELSKLKDPKYLSKNQSSLLKSNDPSYPVNMIDSFNTPFDHIDRIFLQDFSSNLFTESNNYFRDLFSVEFGEKSIVNRIEMSEDGIDYSSVNEQFESGRFFIDSFTYTPFIDYSTVDSKVGIYSDEYLTKYNTGWYDVKSNFVDCNRRNMTSNLYELGNLEKDLYDAKIAFRNAIWNTEFTNRGGQIVPANAKVYIHTFCEHLVTLFAKLSNIRMCHELYGLKSPHCEWDGMLALDIWYNMLYKEIDCGYSFDESYFDVNPMSKLKIQVERNGDDVTRRYVEYQGEQYDVQDETYTVGDYTIMTNGVDDGYALLWNDNVFSKIDSNARKINVDRKWHVLPRGVLCKIHSIVNNQVPINAITDDSSGDFEWFKQSGKVYSDSSKSRYTKYTNLHLGRAYDVMSPTEYCEFTNTEQVDGKYVKPLIEEAISGMKKRMLISGCEALEDAFSVIRNEKLFNIFNSDSNEVEEFNPNNIEHYSESQCAIVIERIFSRMYKYLQFKSTTSEEFEKHINIDSGYKYLTTESLLRNDHVEYRNGDAVKSVYYDDNDTIPYLRYMSKLREYLKNSDILTDEEKGILENVVGDNGILTSRAAYWIHENWDLCPLLKTRINDQGLPHWFSRMVSNDNNIIGKTIVIDYNLDQYMKVDGQTYVENVVYTIEDEDFRLDLSDFQISPIFDDGDENHIDYELLGYSTDMNSNVVYSPDKILSQKDIPLDKSIMVLYAVWKRKYIVRFSHGATGILGEMDDIVVEQNKSTTLPKCNFSPIGKSKLFTYYDNDEIWETTSSIVGEEDFNVEFDGWEYTFNGNRFVVEDQGNILLEEEQNQLNSYPIVVLTARWKPKYDSISFYVKDYKYCDVLIKRSENRLVYPKEEPKLIDEESQFIGWDVLEGDYLSGIDRTSFVVCGDDDIPVICDDGECEIVCEQDEVIEYGLKVNARIGYKTLKKFILRFKYIDSDTKQPHEVYEYVEENSPIPVFHIHDEVDFGEVVKKFRYWRLESGNISSSMTILSDATLVAVYDDIAKPVEEAPELEKVNPNELNDEFVQQSGASQLTCGFNDINCLYVTNGNGDGDLNPKNGIFDSDGGSSGCPFIQLLKLGITHKFDVATIIEIDDVTKLIQALLKINIDIAHREYFMRLDVPNDSSWWYGYIGEKYISFEPCVEYKFSNMHASNQLKDDGKLICCSGEEDIERTIVPVNRELMNDLNSNHYNEYLYHYDYSNSLKNITSIDGNPNLPVLDDCQKYYSIQPLCLYENTIIQSPVDVNGFVKHRLNKIERTDKQVQTYTSIVKKYRPIIVPSVHEIFNGNEYKSKYQVDKENTYGVFGWCSIPSKTMVNMEYNEHSIIVPSSYDRHNHVCGSNFLQMDCDLSNIYRTWDSELNKPVSNIKDSWYYLYNQRDWTYFLKPFFNIKQNNDVYAYFLDTFPNGRHAPVSSNHLNGVVFEPSINGRTSDLSFNDISQTCRFLAKYHHNEMNFDILTKISNEIIPFSKLKEMTSIDGEYNAVYGSRYVGLPESFKYPEGDWISDKNKTSTYFNDYEYNIGWRHAIDDFDEESVWMYITMTIPVEQQSTVIEVKDIMPYVFWWSNRGLQGG